MSQGYPTSQEDMVLAVSIAHQAIGGVEGATRVAKMWETICTGVNCIDIFEGEGAEKFVTRLLYSLIGGTEIRFIFFNSSTLSLTNKYVAGVAGLWVGMSDHGPVIPIFAFLPSRLYLP